MTDVRAQDPLPQVTWISEKPRGSGWSRLQIGVLVLVVASLIPPVIAGQPAIVVSSLIVWPTLWLVVATHELGHVLAARVVGFKFVMAYVIPIRVARQPRGLRVSLRFSWLPPGYAVCVPLKEENLVANLAVYDLGGILANLALGGIAAVIASARGYNDLAFLSIGVPASTHNGVGQFIFDSAVLNLEFLALSIGLLNLLPLRTGGFASDGHHLLGVLRGGPAYDQDYARVLLMSADLGRNERPRDWDEDVMTLALGHGWESKADLWHEAYCWTLDRGDLEGARRHLERAFRTFERDRRSLPAHLSLEMAYFESRYLADTESARKRLLTTPPARGVGCFRYRAEAALLLAQNEPVAAKQHAEAALRLVDVEALEGGRTVQAVDWLHQLIGESDRVSEGNSLSANSVVSGLGNPPEYGDQSWVRSK